MKKGQVSIVIAAVGMISAAILLPASEPSQASIGQAATKVIEIQLPADSYIMEATPAAEPAPEITWKDYKVKKGESMALIFRRAGEQAGTLHAI